MAERRPLVYKDGRKQELPEGDTLRGVPVYVGPESAAPASVPVPTLMILREDGAPAGATSIIVREPDA